MMQFSRKVDINKKKSFEKIGDLYKNSIEKVEIIDKNKDF